MKLLHSLFLTLGLMVAAESLASPVVVPTPANGATGVAVTSPVTFTFDVEMIYTSFMFTPFPGITPTIKWSPSLSFSYSMSADAMTLTCTPTAPLPANTLITWTLNPPDATIPFTDYEDNALPTTTGSFTTAGGGDPDPTGLGMCTLTKTLGYRQTNATTVIIFPEMAAFYGSSVEGTAGNPVTAASIMFSGSSLARVMSQLPGKSGFSDFNGYITQAQLDAALPSGTYTFDIQRQSGPAPMTMNIANATDYPPIPQINNFDAAQTVNPGSDFTFQWTAIPAVKPGDSIHFYINDQNSAEIFSAPSNTLANTSSSLTIPAGLLSAGNTYEGILCFTRTAYIGTNSTAGFVGVASLTRTTYFPIQVAGGTPPTAPKFAEYSLGLNGRFSLTISAQPGSTLIVEACSNLGDWHSVLTTTTPIGGTVVYEDPASAGQSPRFYRARVQ